ncbi:MAG: hypothetical protein FWC40_00840 [Proteobacteria bacterium]|nr:hypothetical protein [Pseudomonadota bacterium]
MSCSSTSSQPTPQKTTQTSASESAQAASPAVESAQTTWGDDMTRASLLGDSTDRQMAMAVIEATLTSNQESYVHFKLGNLAFGEVVTMPHPSARDINAARQSVAVILGKNPYLVNLPDKVLFAHFAKNIRPNPDVLEVDQRTRAALLLATDSGRFEDEPAPTWTDEDGTLVIHYYRYVHQGRGRARPKLNECTLTVDANQVFTHECIDRGYGDK